MSKDKNEEISEEVIEDSTMTISVIDTIVQFDSGKEFKMVLTAESAKELRKSFHEGNKEILTVFNYSLFERKTVVQIDTSKIIMILSVPNEKNPSPEDEI